MLAATLSAAAVVCADTLWESELQKRIPAESISRVSSYDWLGSLSMNPLGSGLIGVAVAYSGATEVVSAVAVVTVVTHA